VELQLFCFVYYVLHYVSPVFRSSPGSLTSTSPPCASACLYSTHDALATSSNIPAAADVCLWQSLSAGSRPGWQWNVRPWVRRLYQRPHGADGIPHGQDCGGSRTRIYGTERMLALELYSICTFLLIDLFGISSTATYPYRL
jgi:hypothetical protein